MAPVHLLLLAAAAAAVSEAAPIPKCPPLPLPNRLDSRLRVEPLPETAPPTSSGDFAARLLDPSRPAVLRGVNAEWPALLRWRLRKDGSDPGAPAPPGDGRFGALFARFRKLEVDVEYAADGVYGYEGTAWKRGETTVGEFWKKMEAQPSFGGYVSTELPEAWEADTPMPDVLPCGKRRGEHYTDTGVWWGGGGQNSLVHNDPDDNVLMVVDGYKQVYLWPPSSGGDLYERMPDGPTLPVTPSKRDRADARRQAARFAKRNFDIEELESVPFSSRVSRVKLEDVDFDEFPRVRNLPPAFEAVLGPGDVLFLPRLWFHQVYSYCNNMAVNHWFDVAGLRQEIIDDPLLMFRSTGDVAALLNSRKHRCDGHLRRPATKHDDL